MLKFQSNALAGIQYSGDARSTQDCIDAVTRLLQCRVPITNARLLSYTNKHALLLTVDVEDKYAVKGGFTSGYGGQGCRGLSYTLSLLDAHEVPIDEVEVSNDILDRLNASGLSTRDIETIGESRPIRAMRWREYIFDQHVMLETNGRLWSEFVPVIPFAIIDRRLIDLAKDFWSDPDQRLMTAFRRLEDIVRQRTGSTECSARLFDQVFNPNGGRLGWPDLDPSEQVGRMRLFGATYMAYRNPRAHSEPSDDGETVLAELLLINHLFRLEGKAVERGQGQTTP